jgi:hypothetical protein
MKKLIFTLMVMCMVASLHAKNNEAARNEVPSKAVVSEMDEMPLLLGRVVDHQTSEKLAGVKILCNGREYYTDLNGVFRIEKRSSGDDVLQISMISYEDKSVQVDPKTRGDLVIQLKQR